MKCNKHPQTKALTVGKYGCLAMCYLYCLGIECDDLQYVRYLYDAQKMGLLDGEFTVLDADRYLSSFSGKDYKVDKKVCIGIKNIIKPTPVRYDYDGAYHWVVVENGEIVFNPLLNSICVNKGRPSTMRVISLK